MRPGEAGLFRLMTADTEFVAVRVAEIRAIVVRMILRAQAGGALAAPAGGQRNGMASVDRPSASSQQCYHLPFPGIAACPS